MKRLFLCEKKLYPVELMLNQQKQLIKNTLPEIYHMCAGFLKINTGMHCVQGSLYCIHTLSEFIQRNCYVEEIN